MARISGSTRICTLVLTLCFLVFEIVVGQICRSLLIAVDSFHTLYIFINLALSALKHHPNSPCSPDPSTTAAPSRPNVSASGGPSPPCAEDYRRMRLKPFGNLISALLMASQCVSISLEILTHVVQPEPILHPLLSIVVGGASLIFNMLVLAWKRSSRGIDEAAEGNRKSLTRNDPHSTSESKGSALQDDALMFCNPEASRVLDPDQGSQHSSSELPEHSITEAVQSSHSQKSNSRISESSQEIIPEDRHHSTCTEPTVSQCIPEGSGCRRQQLGSIGVIQHLLGSVLVLTNGLVLLLSAAHCHRPHSDCHLLVYLDAGFSAVCVLVLLSTALPKLQRYGLLVLQATPLHLSVAQVRLRLTEVPGVLSVHELHVWQLSDALMVASLHVHCPDGLNAAQCADLMGRTKAVLAAFGINHCTVQPEFIRSDAAAGGGSGRSLCSLRCGQECVEKLCCSPQVDKTSCPKTESPACVQPCSPAPHSVDEHRDVVIENTYL
ncbi:zinc/cadmium resistance protein [Sinocyclocheilus grahami]|uniref:zinc/cadmium resistance protein n=1 Tax=Sinocyclocheilus grahami TaxID=75366 RepID=UPI0007AD1556|nr:PREDICTED: zinc/cadmium resistance protein-like [Sinocyclocheilus grahami]